jgi:hypothetical protein
MMVSMSENTSLRQVRPKVFKRKLEFLRKARRPKESSEESMDRECEESKALREKDVPKKDPKTKVREMRLR